jgi:ectoine hydroxylase-related dioxygenase (phytanoyl-CoA dioxygenase family)
MLQKKWHHNVHYSGPAHEGSRALERDGHYLLRNAFASDEIAALRAEILEVYRCVPPDMRAGRTSVEDASMYRYEMFNRSPLCQKAIGNDILLSVLEPLLGQDCHAITCTAWQNPPGNEAAPKGLQWHVDGGPHVPRPRWSRWPRSIPYPVFVVAMQLYLDDVGLAEGPTAFAPGSHTSGRLPPSRREWDLTLRYGGRRSVAHVARAGDVSLFVSDVWHRRLPPAPDGKGRFFLQTNFGRRDIAQRVRPTHMVNHAAPGALARAVSERARQLIGVHEAGFYDG